MKLKNIFAVLVAVSGLGLFTGCATTPAQSTTNPSEHYPNGSLDMALMASMDAFPIFLAYELGFFAEQGLNMRIERFFSAQERDASFQVDDRFDGLVFDGLALAIYNNAGFDMVAVSSSIGLASLIGAAGIERVEDIVGETVLISFNTAMDYILHTALERYNIDPSAITIEGVPQLPVRLEMLRAGQAGAATLPEPMASIAVQDPHLRRLTTTHDLDINPFILAFRRSTVENYPDAMAAFYRGWNQAVDFMNNAAREDFVDILVDIVGFPEDMRDTLTVPNFPHGQMPSHAHIQDVLDFAYTRGIVQTQFNAEVLVSDFLR